MDQKVNRCVVCGYMDDSRLDVTAHVMEDHSLDERLNELVNREQRPETEAA